MEVEGKSRELHWKCHRECSESAGDLSAGADPTRTVADSRRVVGVRGNSGTRTRNAHKKGFSEAKSGKVFGQTRRSAKMFRAVLYARVSTNDQTLAMQNRAMREYVAQRSWTIAMQVREVNSRDGSGAE